ncbi:MAG TPA: hypothetical protein VEJ63_05345 [Planctomycetota bacterium]|nr:hypothetical protein [Planctomycetota bacterium]
MDIIIQRVEDQTPKGLTTGFRVRLFCATTDNKPFVTTAAILVSKDVMAKQIPLSQLVLAALQKTGLEEYVNELFVDSRRLNLDAIATTEPTLPMTLKLGGVEILNQKVVEKLAKG